AGDVFAGGDAHRDALEALIKDLAVGDAVSLVGWVDDVDGLLVQNEVFVLPSERPEPFGLVLAEAMAQGMACVATDAGGPAEMITDGVNGLLVPMGDADALANAIGRLLADARLRRQLGDTAAADIREQFSFERTLDGVIAVYNSIL